MTPQQLFNHLRARPAYIVRYYQLTIAGGPVDAWTQFAFAPRVGVTNPRPGRFFGRLNMHRAQAFRLTHAPLPGPPHVFPAYNVRMQNAGTYAIAALNGLLLPEPGPPALMLTGQLSGCTFCCKRVGGGVLAAHLRPAAGGGAGLALNLSVRNNGRFAGHAGPLDGVYGRMQYNGLGGFARAAVVGSRIGGQWQFYGQEYNNATHQILSTMRIL
ncbi:MAG: hypothetical protein AAGC60_01010 [Acidobacteriota bacterium]